MPLRSQLVPDQRRCEIRTKVAYDAVPCPKHLPRTIVFNFYTAASAAIAADEAHGRGCFEQNAAMRQKCSLYSLRKSGLLTRNGACAHQEGPQPRQGALSGDEQITEKIDRGQRRHRDANGVGFEEMFNERRSVH